MILFLDLATDESQLDFPILYGSSRIGFVTSDPLARSGDMKPLFEAIIKTYSSTSCKSGSFTNFSDQS